jgi:sulfur-carrier protein
MAALDILYFGSLREALGRDGERVDPPSHVLTIEDLRQWLTARGEPHSTLLSDPANLGAAIEHHPAGPNDSFFGARQVALFPKITGI